MVFRILMSCFLLSFSIAFCLGQSDPCGTEDTRDDVYNFDKDQISKWHRGDVIEIPISIHLMRNEIGVTGLSKGDWYDALDTLNERYADAGITFVQCGPVHEILVNEYLTVTKGTESDLIANTYNVPNTLNIYVPNQIESGDNTICGFGKFPWALPRDHIFVKTTCMRNESTLSHEVGHYFGILHTHSTSAGIEYVNGTNCEFAGDELCDTPADPRLSSSNVSGNCYYIGNEVDPNGDLYEPDVENLMSYSLKSCRKTFTQEQFNRMNFYAVHTRDYLICDMFSASEEYHLNSRFNIFPNPANDVLQINWREGSTTETVSYCVYDNFGKIVDEGQFLGHAFRLPLNAPTGIYFLQLRINEGIAGYHFFVQ
jgi:hypothetical protein